jgi:hypothetical protein
MSSDPWADPYEAARLHQKIDATMSRRRDAEVVFARQELPEATRLLAEARSDYFGLVRRLNGGSCSPVDDYYAAKGIDRRGTRVDAYYTARGIDRRGVAV